MAAQTNSISSVSVLTTHVGQKGMIMNNTVIGHTTCPHELVLIPLPTGEDFTLKIHYYTGSIITIADQVIAPLIISTRTTTSKI